ncbi:protein of unknown function [Nocardia cyriacigeorgica GUH-2]|uniref:Uncharacterized protein n=1 Tax=Nocardia cyriacigeorgica (strain GUH-2) TaxID=1127134 RepID=H6R4I3_NOCCG|nr:protein of unknown function [Nocardia cyriacigeorgica GUH-2]
MRPRIRVLPTSDLWQTRPDHPSRPIGDRMRKVMRELGSRWI